MKDSDFIFCFIFIAVMFSIIGYFTAIIHVNEYISPLRAAKSKCEEVLPRNQECKLVYQFVSKE